MSARTVKGSEELGKKIRLRRNELGLTIEEVASKAGVGTKTWSRYESGESIRRDKILSVCKVLGWHTLSEREDTDQMEFDLNEYKSREIWPQVLADNLGDAAAVSFVIGSDILLDDIDQDLEALSHRPKGTHIGELDFSWLEGSLPLQFLTEYDYAFLYYLKANVKRYRKLAAVGASFVAHTVIDELTLYLIMKESECLMESIIADTSLRENKREKENRGFYSGWDEWPFDLFADMDVVDYLYSGLYLEKDHCYHFEHWREAQFFMKE